MSQNRITAQIRLDAVKKNLETIQNLIRPGTKTIPVVKTNAYGHGAVPIAAMLETDPSMSAFAVATAEEAIDLREGGVSKPVLILGCSFPEDIGECIENRIELTVASLPEAREISRQAVSKGKCAEIAIKLDTGMHRIGFRPNEKALSEMAEIAALPGIRVKTVFSHFARADEEDLTSAKQQLALFSSFTEEMRKSGIVYSERTISNSAGILSLPEANFDAVRCGIILYGLSPSKEMEQLMAVRGIHFEPAMSLVSHIVFVKEIEEGDAVSYGGTYVAPGRRRVATVPVGYGDGYPRLLSGKAEVLICGKRAKVLGRICMDQFMADITEIPEAAVGTKVTLLGSERTETISAEELGEKSGRFNYELVCGISPRVPRRYIK